MKKRKPEDRRVQRTRALLQDALMALMVERGYEVTTVQDIIDRANVGRATFYAHFADKKTLLVSRLEDLRTTLLQRQREELASGDAEEFQLQPGDVGARRQRAAAMARAGGRGERRLRPAADSRDVG